MFVKDNIRLIYYFYYLVKMVLIIYKLFLFFIGSVDGKERFYLFFVDIFVDVIYILVYFILLLSKCFLLGVGYFIWILFIWVWVFVLFC